MKIFFLLLLLFNLIHIYIYMHNVLIKCMLKYLEAKKNQFY